MAALKLVEDPRAGWRESRQGLERVGQKTHPRKAPQKRNFRQSTYWWAQRLLEYSGLIRWTSRLARQVDLVRHEFVFPDLPDALDGYRILQVTDPHFDRLPGLDTHLSELLAGQTPDLLVFTGDYRDSFFLPVEETQRSLQTVVERVRPKDGTLAVLGNHDTWALVDPLEAIGIQVLTNQHWMIARGEAKLSIAGLDDVHNFYTTAADQCLSATPDGFKLALVHSNEAVQAAERRGFRLYLCGHSHGGQICLPGRIPVLTHSDQPRSLSSGPWVWGGLQGLTSPGCGVVSLALRLFCPPEVSEIILKKG